MKHDEMRAAFEAWCLAWNKVWTPGDVGDGFDLKRGPLTHDGSGYICGETRLHWDLWQAAHAAGRRAGMEEAARWHDEKQHALDRQGDFGDASLHRVCAKKIRALLEGGDDAAAR